MPEYCVTGGTGFIAAYLVKALLEKGHTVRATVRDPGTPLSLSLSLAACVLSAWILQFAVKKANYFVQAGDAAKVGFLWEFPGAKERLKLVKADLMVEGSFDGAVDGADGVFHTASPVSGTFGENVQATLIDPCIKGTVNVIGSCSRARSVKRVVLTSSCSSIRYRDDATEASPLNESHWSDPEYCKRHNLWYAYAKTLGEREAWRLAAELGIDLVVVNPSFVVGPLLAPQPTSTLLRVLSIVKGEAESYPNFTVGFVHIDDVISGHILAMEEPGISGRLVCSSEVAHWSEIVEMLGNKYPSYPVVTKCGDEKGNNNPHTMDTTKIRMLGHGGFKTLAEMFDDCIKSFQKKGFLYV